MASATPLLIDVRTPVEYSAGFLSTAASGDALNIEYQLIDQLPSIAAAARSLTVDKTSSITLYCHSGRRSNIALQTLLQLGYSNVRNIGGLEEARAVLQKEETLRGLVGNTNTGAVEKEKLGDETSLKDGEEKAAREKSLTALLSGLKGLE
ncbi:hypothetical protein K504DRAFT_502000 [Pleomassaria siparia CBS 279.74]|uniref:Rhodanese domain-containing protein n=1 Tax=Pleomassaria siparia CBS 279.74 TaxID=1314801 RepID=A0A6G1K9Q2_9PLEO|nr:hypothetical protein K504DRAFT_502000 [Pleomassaria siparia CBS 279.74]